MTEQKMDGPTLEQELRDVLRGRADALVARDINALKLLLGDELTYVNSYGDLWTKADYLKAVVEGELRWERQWVDDLLVRGYGDTAIVTCRVHDTGTWEGEAFQAVFRSTQVYVRRGGAWVYVAGQTVTLAQG